LKCNQVTGFSRCSKDANYKFTNLDDYTNFCLFTTNGQSTPLTTQFNQLFATEKSGFPTKSANYMAAVDGAKQQIATTVRYCFSAVNNPFVDYDFQFKAYYSSQIFSLVAKGNLNPYERVQFDIFTAKTVVWFLQNRIAMNKECSCTKLSPTIKGSMNNAVTQRCTSLCK
jgi:hypothetical protein